MSNIRVVARVRPLTPSEEQTEDVFTYDEDNCQTISADAHTFSFDHVYTPQASQSELFYSCFNENVDNALDGFDSAVIAYGQTAAGKSYTMIGGNTEETEGIIPRAIRRIFSCQQDLLKSSDQDSKFEIELTYVEIHKEKVYDLFNQRAPLQVLSDGTPKDATHIHSASLGDSLRAVNTGVKLRTTASTKMNSTSSRSHSILSIILSNRARLMLVDLAGSETVKKTGASGTLLQEAGSINQSLTSLAMVVSALTSSSGTTTGCSKTANSSDISESREALKYVPYRTSKLTQMLQSALGGNSVTTLIINCSPLAIHMAESLNSLRFGARAKLMKSKKVDVVSKIEFEFWRLWNVDLEKALRKWQLFGPPPVSQLLDLSPVLIAISEYDKTPLNTGELRLLQNFRQMETYPLDRTKDEDDLAIEEEILQTRRKILNMSENMNAIRDDISALKEKIRTTEEESIKNESISEEQRGARYYEAIMRHSIELDNEEKAIAEECLRLEQEIFKFVNLPPSPADIPKHCTGAFD